MTMHRFTANVPNPTGSAVQVRLRLQAATPADFAALHLNLPATPLTVRSATISFDPCADRGDRELIFQLPPHSSRDVHVIVDTAPPSPSGIAGFHLVDERGGKPVGGVFLPCVDPPLVDPPGQAVAARNPCPAALLSPFYWIVPGNDPSVAPVNQPIPLGQTVELVAAITNPTTHPLRDTQIYLEHLGESNAELRPGTWSVGVLEPGQTFYATWLIRTSGWQFGVFKPAVVVSSAGRDPVRLDGKMQFGPPGGGHQ